MADDIRYQIHGDDLQVVEIELDPGEAVRAEVGAMMYMEEEISMQTGLGGGIFAGLKRKLTGEQFFITSFVNKSKKDLAHVAFAAPYPGRIIPLDLAELGGGFICQKDSFLCAAKGIDIEVAFTRRLGAGFFGGEGFILQRLEGAGKAFVHAGGTIIRKELQRKETLRVDTGCVVGFTPDVEYKIKFVGGFRNAMFGREGVYLAFLEGPGVVYLQSLPFARLVDRIQSTAAQQTGAVEDDKG
ncbi:MAG: TIGR00266 family protein [Bacteroidota bacterium]